MSTQPASSVPASVPQQPSANLAASGTTSSATLPQDAQAIIAMLRELGVSEFEPRVVSQLLDFAYGYVRDVLGEARALANHAGHKQIDVDDIRLAVQFWSDRCFTTALPSPAVVAEMAHARNSQPLPPPRSNGRPIAGVRLPPDRHCLTQAAFQLRSHESMPQQRFVSSNHSGSGSANVAVDRQHTVAVTDHRTYASGASRPSSSFSVAQSSAAMVTDYDNPL